MNSILTNTKKHTSKKIKKPQITKWKSTNGVVRVKIVCTGYKATKGSAPLFAMLPALVFASSNSKVPTFSSAAAALKASGVNALKKSGLVPNTTVSSPKPTATTVTKKKRKEKMTEKPKTKISPASSQVPSSPVPKTYAESSPLARRQQIIERVSQLALELETSLHKEKTVSKLDPVPEEQPPLHTTRMWDWLQSAGFYNKAASSKILASIKAPKIHSRGLFNLTPNVIQGHEVHSEEDHHRVSPASLFDRLQSLLVEQVSDDDMNLDEEESSDEESLSFLDDDDDVDANIDDVDFKNMENGEIYKHPKLDIVDLSELSIEERTFVHLSKAGLIKKSLYPSVNLTITSPKNEGSEEDSFGDVIGAMSTDLARMTSMNNARIAFIESQTSDAVSFYNKQVEEEQAVLIAKCQNLMKRTKEKAKKAKLKKDENLNLPW